MPRRPATNSPDFPIASRRIPPPEVRPPLPSSSDHSGVPNRALFTVAEALQVLGVSRQTLYRALHEDRLCAHKIRGKTVFKRASRQTNEVEMINEDDDDFLNAARRRAGHSLRASVW